jgi:hypothetical protein
MGRTVPEHDQRLIGELGPQPAQHIDRVVAVGPRIGPQPPLAFVGQIKAVEGDARGQARRTRIDPEALPALGPAGAEVRVRVDMRLIQGDQQMPIALGTGQQALEAPDKGLPPLRVGSAQQLLGFLPGQLEVDSLRRTA